ncbi:hypothetical protein JMA_38710 (plasmid) [Jeotgalibacillus malaysiensis]|uniref:Uncharacterized protein n=1 Tax=Jeotgalibacillus malaysiensis TaxID=1508404 RepID=A0A0B5AYX3_9BACL|nr:hypothetical protein [Jeotgalibacillus malaysiensis]AJD93189.1 hypothetical protein JMA_38710 [Jeotgalibacillus malaysiensis]
MNSLYVWLVGLMVVVSLPFILSLYKEYKTVKNFERQGMKVYSNRMKKLLKSKEDLLHDVFLYAMGFMAFDFLYALSLSIFLGAEQATWDIVFIIPLILSITMLLSFLSYKQLFGKKRIQLNKIPCEDLLSLSPSQALVNKIGLQSWCILMEKKIEYGTHEFYLLRGLQQDFELKKNVEYAMSKASNISGADDTIRKAKEKMTELNKRIESAFEALRPEGILSKKENEAHQVLVDFIKEKPVVESEEAPEIKELKSLLEEELTPEQRKTITETLEEIQQRKSEKTEDVDNDMRVKSIVRAARMMNGLEDKKGEKA